MTREDFKITANYYSTNALTYILLNGVVVGFVETFKDLYFKQIDKDKWESQKKKRIYSDVILEAESFINKFIKSAQKHKN